VVTRPFQRMMLVMQTRPLADQPLAGAVDWGESADLPARRPGFCCIALLFLCPSPSEHVPFGGGRP
jgi:hypothetical protein